MGKNFKDRHNFHEDDSRLVRETYVRQNKVNTESSDCPECGTKIFIDSEGEPEICTGCGHDPLDHKNE